MPIIQQNAKATGDAEGCDYFGGFFNDGVSPFWVTKERALDVPNAEEVAAFITKKYGYELTVGSKAKTERDSILARMKSGEIEKSAAIEMLRNLKD